MAKVSTKNEHVVALGYNNATIFNGLRFSFVGFVVERLLNYYRHSCAKEIF